MKRIYWVLLIVVLAVVLAGGYGVYNWTKPGVNIEEADALPIKAESLVASFNKNETTANEAYLGKALAVTGVVEKVSQNQDGQTTVLMSGGDPLTGVFFTLRDKGQTVQQGATVTIKGFCSGKTTDVTLSKCVVVQN